MIVMMVVIVMVVVIVVNYGGDGGGDDDDEGHSYKLQCTHYTMETLLKVQLPPLHINFITTLQDRDYN